MGFSAIDGEYINLKWMREAELKHGRVAMLATSGWLATDLGFHFTGTRGARSARRYALQLKARLRLLGVRAPRCTRRCGAHWIVCACAHLCAQATSTPG